MENSVSTFDRQLDLLNDTLHLAALWSNQGTRTELRISKYLKGFKRLTLLRTVDSLKNHRVHLAKPTLYRISYIKTEGRWYEEKKVGKAQL